MFSKYIQTLTHIDDTSKVFIIRQIQRMPDYYRFGVIVICLIFYILRLSPKNLKLLNKLILSLNLVKTYE
mgnify:CR=1